MYIEGKILRETEKAILFKPSKSEYKQTWLPKSKISYKAFHVIVPDWLEDKMINWDYVLNVYGDAVKQSPAWKRRK